MMKKSWKCYWGTSSTTTPKPTTSPRNFKRTTCSLCYRIMRSHSLFILKTFWEGRRQLCASSKIGGNFWSEKTKHFQFTKRWRKPELSSESKDSGGIEFFTIVYLFKTPWLMNSNSFNPIAYYSENRSTWKWTTSFQRTKRCLSTKN